MEIVSDIQDVDIFELTCPDCGHIFRILNDDRQELYEEYCTLCEQKIICDHPYVNIHKLSTISINLNTFEVVTTICYLPVENLLKGG